MHRAVLESSGKVRPVTRLSCSRTRDSLPLDNNANRQDSFVKVIANGSCIERDLGLSKSCLDIGLTRNFLERKFPLKSFLQVPQYELLPLHFHCKHSLSSYDTTKVD